MVGTADSVLIREVSLIQSVLYIEWSHCVLRSSLQHVCTLVMSFDVRQGVVLG